MNLETVRSLRASGIEAIYGDASRREILENAGVRNSGTLILSASGIHDGAELIRLARELNPGIRVLARATYVRDIAALHAAGANHVYAGEGEVALALIEAVLRPLGATADQIDREGERFRAEFLTPPADSASGAVN
jgi:CPA2 family monovalent cation:H+ antiporter-2